MAIKSHETWMQSCAIELQQRLFRCSHQKNRLVLVSETRGNWSQKYLVSESRGAPYVNNCFPIVNDSSRVDLLRHKFWKITWSLRMSRFVISRVIVLFLIFVLVMILTTMPRSHTATWDQFWSLKMNPSRYLYYHCFDLFTALGRSLPLFSLFYLVNSEYL